MAPAAACCSRAQAGLPGGLIGILVGSRLGTERWEEVPLGGVCLTLLPLGSRAYLAVAVTLR